MSTKARHEELSALGDFIRVSFARDQAVIAARFPKLGGSFLEEFTEKLEAIKVLESRWVMTQAQKRVSASLYHEAGVLSKELNFVKTYLTQAGLDTRLVMDLKKALYSNNIESAILKIENLKQYIVPNMEALELEGLAENFVQTLQSYKTSLEEKNALQNTFMNNRKALTETNRQEYMALGRYITSIMSAGRLVFDGSVLKDEYSPSKTIKRMRSAKLTEGSSAA
jgi:hypothetical protein